MISLGSYQLGEVSLIEVSERKRTTTKIERKIERREKRQGKPVTALKQRVITLNYLKEIERARVDLNLALTLAHE
jgi:hypothetical protein